MSEQHREDEITAYHEAGHAVLALIVGRVVDRVSITPRAGRLGVMELKGRSKKRRFRDRAEDDLLVLLGGMVAEVRLTGQYCTEGAGYDLRVLKQVATARGGSREAGMRLCEKMFGKADHLLGAPAHWLAVRYIVEDLLEKRDISGRAARHHFERALREVG